MLKETLLNRPFLVRGRKANAFLNGAGGVTVVVKGPIQGQKNGEQHFPLYSAGKPKPKTDEALARSIILRTKG